MFKQTLIAVIYLLDYWAGRMFYIICYLLGKGHKIMSLIKKRIYPIAPCFFELHYLREEVRRLKFANKVMRQELNRVKRKSLHHKDTKSTKPGYNQGFNILYYLCVLLALNQ